MFAFVNVQADPDGVVRTMPLIYRDQQGKSAYSFAARAAEVFIGQKPWEALSALRLVNRLLVDWTKFHRISWKDARMSCPDSRRCFAIA